MAPRKKKPVNSDIVFDVVSHTDLKVEVGGGIRDMETVEFYLKRGISRVILGSVALKNPVFRRGSSEEVWRQNCCGN